MAGFHHKQSPHPIFSKALLHDEYILFSKHEEEEEEEEELLMSFMNY